MEKVKTCTRCGLEKPVSEFTNSGRGSWCKACHALECREWRERNKTRSPRRANLDAMPWEEIFRRFAAGETANALSLEYGVSGTALRKRLVGRFGSSKRKSLTPRKQKVLDLYNQGLSNSEISAALGWTGNNRSNVSDVLRALGISRTEEEAREARCRGVRLSAEKAKFESETKIRELIESSRLEYLGGYTNCNGFIDVQYPQCGHTGKISCQALRKTGKIQPCAICASEQRQQREKAKAEEREEKAKAKELERKEKEAQKIREKEQRRWKSCAECGNTFFDESKSNHKRYCSSACYNRAYNRQKDAKRRGYKANSTLTKLYRRDGGRCYICGCSCDFEDYQIIDGAFVVGKTYPTVEHVIPICLGGDDGQDNIRLACHHCNTKKSIISDLKVENTGQIAWVI